MPTPEVEPPAPVEEPVEPTPAEPAPAEPREARPLANMLVLLGGLIALIGFYLPWLGVTMPGRYGAEAQVQRISGHGIAQAVSDAGVAWLVLFAALAVIAAYAFLHYARREHECRPVVVIATVVALLAMVYTVVRIRLTLKGDEETQVSLSYQFGLWVTAGGWLLSLVAAFLARPRRACCAAG